MTAVQELAPAYEFSAATDDNSVSLKVQTHAQDEATCFDATFKYPVDIDVYEAREWLVRAAQGHDTYLTELPTPQEEIIGLTRPSGNIDNFAHQMRRFPKVAAALGYAAASESYTKDDQIVTHTTFTYPSLPMLNSAAAQLFPDTSVQFAPFEGGLYTAQEFVTRFAESGEVLVATEQPYQLHDHAIPHILGWLGIGEDFTAPLRRVMGMYVERAAAEKALPDIGIPDINVHGPINDFLNPGNTFIKRLMEKLDLLSADVADEILFTEKEDKGYRPVEESLSRKLELFWTGGGGSLSGRRNAVPAGLLGKPGQKFFDNAARTMWERYRFAQAQASL